MWFALSLAAAMAQAGQFAVVKARARDIPPLILVFWAQALGAAAWALYVLLSDTPFVLPLGSRGWVLAAVALAGAMYYALARGSARGDISIVGPMLALSPVFAILPDFLISGAAPSPLGWIGLALAIAGTASLSRGGSGRLELRGLLRREDALLGLGAAVILGVLSAVDRRNALALGVPSYLLALHAATAVVTGTVALVRTPAAFAASLVPPRVWTVLAHALLAVVGTALQIGAVALAPAAYVNAVRRLSSVFSVVLGRVLFAEPGLADRLTGAALAAAGAACLLLAR
jgi:drug/metabolite transporter (DMT)-like permease